MGEVEKNSFIALPGEEDHSRLMPRNCVSWPGGAGWGVSCLMVQRGCDQLTDILLMGIGGEESESQLCSLCCSNGSGSTAMGLHEILPPTWWGFKYLQAINLIFLCLPGGGRTLPQGCSCSCLFLISPNPPSPQLASIWNLLFGTQGRSWAEWSLFPGIQKTGGVDLKNSDSLKERVELRFYSVGILGLQGWETAALRSLLRELLLWVRVGGGRSGMEAGVGSVWSYAEFAT